MTTPREITHNGLWNNNVALVQLLGLCPLLAVTSTVINGLGLGIATLITLVMSNSIVSLIRGFVRSEVRLPDGPLRLLGQHEIEIHLHTDVNVPLRVEVIADETSENFIDVDAIENAEAIEDAGGESPADEAADR